MIEPAACDGRIEGDPRTRREWRAAAAWAEVLLAIDAARQYGLVEGGPVIHVDRCREVLERAKARGITPREADTDAAFEVLAMLNHAEPPLANGGG